MTELRQRRQNLEWSDWRLCWWTCRWNPTLLCAGRWTRRQETRHMDDLTTADRNSLCELVCWECEWTVSYSWTKWHPNTKQFNLGFQRSNLRCYCREYNNNHKIKLNRRALSSWCFSTPPIHHHHPKNQKSLHSCANQCNFESITSRALCTHEVRNCFTIDAHSSWICGVRDNKSLFSSPPFLME